MSRRKKDKVKAARAREAERLANKSSDAEGIDILDVPESQRKAAEGSASEKSAPEKPVHRKDSKGRKIPTESERRAKGDVARASSSSKDARARKPDKSKKNRGKAAQNKSASSNKSIATKAKIAFWRAAAHPFIALVTIIVLIVFGVALAGLIEETVGTDTPTSAEESKTYSLIGMTSPARALLDDTGKFDGFWSDGDTGIAYADLFDRDVTAQEQEVLKSRGQAIGEDYAFSYNEEISSAKPAKDAAAEKALTDAGTAENTIATGEKNSESSDEETSRSGRESIFG